MKVWFKLCSFSIGWFLGPMLIFQGFSSFPRLPWCHQEVVNKAEEKATTEETKKRLREVKWVKTIGLVGVRFGWGVSEVSTIETCWLVGETPRNSMLEFFFFCQLMVNCWFGARWFGFLGPKDAPSERVPLWFDSGYLDWIPSKSALNDYIAHFEIFWDTPDLPVPYIFGTFGSQANQNIR